MKAEIGDLGWEADGASDSIVMILTCPECATSYFVDDSRIAAAGRVVKCSNCGARWRAMPDGAEELIAAAAGAAAIEPEPATPSAVDDLVIEGPSAAERPFIAARPAAPAREVNGKVVVWAVSAVVAAGLIASAILFRAQVVQRFPASEAAYAGLGLPVSSLAIEEVHVDPAFEGGRPVLSVTGQIRNLRDAAASSPPLRVSLLDRLGKPVATKVARPIDAAIPSHAIRHFAISLVDPPAAAHDLEVKFEAPAKGAPKPISVPVSAVPAAAPTTAPGPADAKPLPPGSPDALPTHP